MPEKKDNLLEDNQYTKLYDKIPVIVDLNIPKDSFVIVEFEIDHEAASDYSERTRTCE